MFCEIFVADRGQKSEKIIPTDLPCCKSLDVCYNKNKNQQENPILLTIQNTHNTAVIYADTIDSGTEGMLREFCGLPLSAGSRIRVMPDVHAGKGCVIGLTMTVTDCVAPGLIGVDIGCGILAVRLDAKRLDLQKLDKLIHEKIPAGRNVRTKTHRFAEQAELERLHCFRHIQADKAHMSIGTLGGGNHFIEVDRGGDGSYWLIVHSGSRHFGAETANFYQREAYRQDDSVPYEFACLTGDGMTAYLHDLAVVQEFASFNRRAIADEIVRGMKADIAETVECVHNYVDTDAMILRKGAISASEGERVVIPMNMRDGCLLGIGKGNAEWNYSAPHGAGRIMSRAETKNHFTLSQYKKEMKGIYTTSVSRETLDESPMAYKPMEAIVGKIGETVDVVERITPVYNFKAGEE